MKKLRVIAMAILLGASVLAGCGKNTATVNESAAASSESISVTAEEFDLTSDGKKIYGMMYKPEDGKEKHPTVVLCHGYNTNADMLDGYGKSWAKKGYLCYAFDFCGGSIGSRSEGSSLDMSVLTEVQNLSDVMDQLLALDYVDSSNFFLMGQSQGGFVAALTAAKRSEEVKALVLYFPALSIPEGRRALYSSLDEVPDEEEIMGMTIGRKYTEDAFNLDAYEEISKYHGDVLICHGDKDQVVDLSYSEKAVEVYDHAELKVIEYAEHGFQAKTAKKATEYTLEFLDAHLD